MSTDQMPTHSPLTVLSDDESMFRELKERFGSPYGWGEYFRGGMGAESIRDLLEQVDLEAEAADLEEQIKTAKGQKQQRAVKRLKVVSAFLNSSNKPDVSQMRLWRVSGEGVTASAFSMSSAMKLLCVLSGLKQGARGLIPKNMPLVLPMKTLRGWAFCMVRNPMCCKRRMVR